MTVSELREALARMPDGAVVVGIGTVDADGYSGAPPVQFRREVDDARLAKVELHLDVLSKSQETVALLTLGRAV